MIRSKQIKGIDSFDEKTGMCILITHSNGRMRVGINQCDEAIVNMVLDHHKSIKNNSDESKISSKKWWQFWKQNNTVNP